MASGARTVSLTRCQTDRPPRPACRFDLNYPAATAMFPDQMFPVKKLISLGLLLLATCLALPASAQDDDALPALVEVLKTADDPQLQLDILKGMSAGLKGRRGVKMPAGWEEVAAKLGKSSDAKVKELVQSLSLTFGSGAALTTLRQQLLDAKAGAATRKAALEALLSAKDPTLASTLQLLLNDADLRGAALRGLAAYDHPASAAAILKVFPSLAVAEKRDALNTLSSRSVFAKPLLAAIGKGEVSAKDLSADIVRQLRNFKDAEINQQVEKLWGVARESGEEKVKEMAKYKAMIQAGPAGSASKGRAVYARTCQQCHTLFDVGGKVGPDITGSNRADLDYILHNMVDPNAEIPNDYRTANLETKDDRVITGIVKAQDNQAVTIVTANETLTIPRAEVQSLRQGEISMMPEGLLQAFSNEEIRDLIAYLKSPAQVPLPEGTK
jgi:putative heme-binding domain-containing protein